MCHILGGGRCAGAAPTRAPTFDSPRSYGVDAQAQAGTMVAAAALTMSYRSVVRTAFVTALATFGLLSGLLPGPVRPAGASCGCEKPPPVAAAIRPSFAFPARDLFSPCDLTHGGCVALFADGLVEGQTYGVDFTQGSGHHRRVDVVARRARDLADGS